MKGLYAFIAVNLLSGFVGQAQYLIEEHNHYVRWMELGIGATAYIGDLSDRYDFWSPYTSLVLHFAQKNRWGSQLQLSIGAVRGENYSFIFQQPDVQVNTAFVTRLQALQYRLNFMLVRRRHWHLYLQAGIGLLRYDPQDMQGQSLAEQRNTRMPGEEYGTLTWMLPLGMGSRYILANGWGIHAQLGWWNPMTDYIDNIGRLGQRIGNDNILSFRWGLLIPIRKEGMLRLIPTSQPSAEPLRTR